MNLYLDDNSAKVSLVNLLRRTAHQVALPTDFGLAGAPDARHLAVSANRGLVLLTRDHDDFLDLDDLVRATRGSHPGILVVRFDNDPSHDMKDRDILR